MRHLVREQWGSDKVDDLVRSEDVFFFISYAQEKSQEKKRVVEASARRLPAIPTTPKLLARWKIFD
jgi:hypothetical protein